MSWLLHHLGDDVIFSTVTFCLFQIPPYPPLLVTALVVVLNLC